MLTESNLGKAGEDTSELGHRAKAGHGSLGPLASSRHISLLCDVKPYLLGGTFSHELKLKSPALCPWKEMLCPQRWGWDQANKLAVVLALRTKTLVPTMGAA